MAPSEAQPPLHLFLRIYRANNSPLLSLTPYPPPVIDSEGLLTEPQPTAVADTTRGYEPTPESAPSETRTAEKHSTPGKSWADVVDSTVPPIGPP